MALAYVLITTKPMKEDDVQRKLASIESITEFLPLFGEYDFIAKIESQNYEELGEIVISQIRGIEGVEFTKKVRDKLWGMREFGISTIDSHRILVGQDFGKD